MGVMQSRSLERCGGKRTRNERARNEEGCQLMEGLVRAVWRRSLAPLVILTQRAFTRTPALRNTGRKTSLLLHGPFGLLEQKESNIYRTDTQRGQSCVCQVKSK